MTSSPLPDALGLLEQGAVQSETGHGAMARFQQFRQQSLKGKTDLLDAGLLAPYQVLPSRYPDLFPPPTPRSSTPSRKDLATALSNALQYQDAAGSIECLVSRGVRDSLGNIFKAIRKSPSQSRLWLPFGGWPVYQALAREAGLETGFYESPLQSAWESLEATKGWVILVCDPPRLPGRRWSEADWERLGRLARKSRGKILVDSAQNFGLSPGVKKLLGGGHAAWLGTLSTQWLLPYCAGMVLAPSSMAEQWRPIFKHASLPAQSRALAHAALVSCPDRPDRVCALLENARGMMGEALSQRSIAYKDPGRGYLLSSPLDAKVLLEKGVLAIPESAFGGAAPGSVLSALALA